MQTGDTDADGISISANSVDVPTGASITDKAGNNAVVTHAGLPAQADHTVSTEYAAVPALARRPTRGPKPRWSPTAAWLS